MAILRSIRDFCRGRSIRNDAFTFLTVFFIIVFHRIAPQDRLVLNLYYLAICGTAYVLLQRRAFSHLTLLLVVAFGTTTACVYFTPKAGPVDSLNNPAADFIVWCVLLVLSWRMAHEAFAQEAEVRRKERQRQFEKMVLDARAAALNCAAHELRTPVTGIVGSAEILVNEAAHQLSDVEREFLTDIYHSSQYLGVLLNDMLEYARGQTGRIQLSPSVVDLREIVRECTSVINGHLRKYDIQLEVEKEPFADWLVADALRLKQILLNLLSNAVNHSSPKTVVRLRVQRSGDDVLFVVSDQGPGMTAEQSAHVFEPFYRIDNKRRSVGTGLGLAIAKLLVDLHGGSIAVDSTPGSGTAFLVSLPCTGCQEGNAEDANWGDVTVDASNEDHVAAPFTPHLSSGVTQDDASLSVSVK